jgi:hypothetical protein
MPLSRDPAKRRKQLRNLPNLRGEPTAASWKPGQPSPYLKHGLRSRKTQPPEVIDPILDGVLADLETKVPIRDEQGEVPAWLREMAWSAAISKLQAIRCTRYLAQHGETDERGRYRPENEGLRKANESHQRALDRLAMTVGSYAAAGLDLARAQQFDLARHWAEHPPADLAGDAEEVDE